MGYRCGDCNKFVGVDEQDAENVSLDLDGTTVTAEVSIKNGCSECGAEMREYTFSDLSNEHEDAIHEHITLYHPELLKAKKAELDDEDLGPADVVDDLGLEVNEKGLERDSKTEGKGRGARTFYGFKLEYEISCALCLKAGAESALVLTESFNDFCQATEMEETC